ncbi:MAG TPA: carboxypeptidase regulatory-like domain-containing protein [Bryobacteraceae bacterium]|nr:carboxypeptidase regulatory-like domain-containing protein [Bryobacteraceae bacterium]
MKSGLGRSLCIFILAALAVTMTGFGQVDVATATLKGIVLDPNAAFVPGAMITVMNGDRGISKTVTTSAEGSYQIPLLPPGMYTIQVEAKGFEKAVANQVELTVGQSAVFDVHLKIGSVKDVVVVTDAAPLIETEKTQQANTINTQQIGNLPNMTRNFTDSVFTLPGVSNSDAPRAQNPGYTGFLSSGFSIGGSNGRNNLVTFDGGENDFGSGQLRTPNISVESVQEFQVNRSAFAAEFGFTAGTAVNVVTKSGSNKMHGDAYAFFRDQATETRNFFDRTAGKPFDQSFFPGATLGGPIKKDKLFFFSSFEFRRVDTPRFRTYLNTPEAQGINGSPDQLNYVNQLANSGVPTLQGIAATFKQILVPMNNPNVVKLLTANDGIFTDRTRSKDWVTRLDYQPGNKDTLTVRFSLEYWDYTTIGASNLYAVSDASYTHEKDYTLLTTWNRTFTPELVNQLRVQIVPHNKADQPPFSPGTTELSIGNLGIFNQSYTNPYSSQQDRFQFEDSLAWMKGAHTIKFGGSYRPVNYRVENDLWFGGEFDFYEGTLPLITLVPAAAQPAVVQFNLQHGYAATGPTTTNLSALESFSLGLPITYRQGFNNPVWQDWAHYLGVFAQDSWKVSPKFTLNYGVRMDYDAEPAPLHHNVYFSPRLGFAWDPFGDQKTVIRAGAGIFVAPVYFQVPYLVNLLSGNGKYINQVAKVLSSTDATVPTLWGLGLQLGKLPFGQLTSSDLAMLGISTAAGAPGAVDFNIAPDYKNNYSIQASLGIARELTRSLSLELGYQMYRGIHIQTDQEVNFAETGAWDPIWGPQYKAINPALTQQNLYSSIGNSTYHGGTVSLTKRYSDNLQGQVNYTFSKAIDDTTDFNSQFASFFPTRLNLERGLSAYNVKHNFVANAVYLTPFKAGRDVNFLSHILADLTLSPIVSMRSGIPFSIRVPGAANGTLGHSLFARPWYIGRNTGIGPDYYGFDMRLQKSFYINRDSGVRFEFIAEGTNLLNHTNFSSVNDQFAVGDPFLTSGQYHPQGNRNLDPSLPLAFTSAFPGRQIQFGLKLVW